MSDTKIYFPNLNGLRFIAAFMVIIHHIEQFLHLFKLKNNWENPVVRAIGVLGVELFFVLSGFLITYLILAEEHKTYTISIKDFYIRRILRIWPLYYLIGILAFFVLPNLAIFNLPNYTLQLQNNFNISLLLYLFFLPNVLLFGHGLIVPFASQSWSVGVEEQFYLMLPLLMKFFKNKLALLFSVLFLYFFVRFVGFRLIQNHFFWNSSMEFIERVWHSFKIYCMAIGAFFSYALFYKKKIISFFLNSYVYGFTVVITLTSIFLSINLPIIYDIFFGIIILNLATSEKKGLFLESSIMDFLGRISYGLYMYHSIIIVICINVFQYLGWFKNYILLLLTVTLLTIFTAYLSYYVIEKKFIILKNRFSKVISGENAK